MVTFNTLFNSDVKRQILLGEWKKHAQQWNTSNHSQSLHGLSNQIHWDINWVWFSGSKIVRCLEDRRRRYVQSQAWILLLVAGWLCLLLSDVLPGLLLWQPFPSSILSHCFSRCFRMFKVIFFTVLAHNTKIITSISSLQTAGELKRFQHEPEGYCL